MNRVFILIALTTLTMSSACDGPGGDPPAEGSPAASNEAAAEGSEEEAEEEAEPIEEFAATESDEASAAAAPEEPEDPAERVTADQPESVAGLKIASPWPADAKSTGDIRALGNLSSHGATGKSGEAGKKKPASGHLSKMLSSGDSDIFGGVGGTGYGRGGGGIAVSPGAGGMGYRGSARGVPQVRTGSVSVNGKSAQQFAARGNRGAPAPIDNASSSEQYTDHGVNKFVDASEDAKSTFAIDVDTGSYTIARRKLQSGALPPKAAVRVEEFVNYFDYSYRPPTNGDPFAVHLEAAPTPLAGVSDRYLLRVGVQGKKIRDEDRKPVHLTFLVDVSGSMRSPDKIGLVKSSLEFLTDNLQPSDTVAIATYAGNTRKVLDRTSVAQKSRIIDAIDGLDAGGSTAMNDGLKLAYGLAMKDFDPANENRVIVLSDGDANVGPRRHSDILDEVSTYVKKGVTLSTVGFGMGNYRDTLMEQLANKGNGNYSYIDSISEAEKVFGKQLDGTLQVIAKDVKIQVEFNPKAVARYRLVGYENRDIADKDFRNDKVDAGEIGAGHTVTAIYELDLAVPASDLPDDIATVRVRNKTPRGSKAVERSFPLKKSKVQTTLRKASKDYQFAAAVVAFAEKLRESPYAEKISYGLIEEIAAAAAGNDPDRKEFVSLVQKAARL